jgi:hypothetical protein
LTHISARNTDVNIVNNAECNFFVYNEFAFLDSNENVDSLTPDQLRSEQPGEDRRKDASQDLGTKFKDSNWCKRLAFYIVSTTNDKCCLFGKLSLHKYGVKNPGEIVSSARYTDNVDDPPADMLGNRYLATYRWRWTSQLRIQQSC